jgi:hypothetical protein
MTELDEMTPLEYWKYKNYSYVVVNPTNFTTKYICDLTNQVYSKTTLCELEFSEPIHIYTLFPFMPLSKPHPYVNWFFSKEILNTPIKELKAKIALGLIPLNQKYL